VTLATPHYGTPVAGFFTSLLGAQLLGALSLATSYVLRTGRLPLDVLAKLGAAFVRATAAGGQGGWSDGLRKLHERILGDIGPDRRGALQSFAELIARDQDLLPQITPAAIDVFNAATQDRPGVRYGCVITQARGASLRSFLSAFSLRPRQPRPVRLHQPAGGARPGRSHAAAGDGAVAGAEVGVRRVPGPPIERRHRPHAEPGLGAGHPRGLGRPPGRHRALPPPDPRAAALRLAHLGQRVRPAGLRGHLGRGGGLHVLVIAAGQALVVQSDA
jgi:hypothetical protein